MLQKIACERCLQGFMFLEIFLYQFTKQIKYKEMLTMRPHPLALQTESVKARGAGSVTGRRECAKTEGAPRELASAKKIGAEDSAPAGKDSVGLRL
jgi:hypothetical protein